VWSLKVIYMYVALDRAAIIVKQLIEENIYLREKLRLYIRGKRAK